MVVQAALRIGGQLLKAAVTAIKSRSISPLLPVASRELPVKGAFIRHGFTKLPEAQRIIIEQSRTPIKTQVVKAVATPIGIIGLGTATTTIATGKLPKPPSKEEVAIGASLYGGYRLGGVGGAIGATIPVATALGTPFIKSKIEGIGESGSDLYSSVEANIEKAKARAQSDIDELIEKKNELERSISDIVSRQNQSGVQWVNNAWRSTDELTEIFREKLKTVKAQLEFVAEISSEQLKKLQEELIKHKELVAAAGLGVGGVIGAVNYDLSRGEQSLLKQALEKAKTIELKKPSPIKKKVVRRRPTKKKKAKKRMKKKSRLKFGSPAWRKKYLTGKKRSPRSRKKKSSRGSGSFYEIEQRREFGEKPVSGKRVRVGTEAQYRKRGGKKVFRTKTGQPYIILADGRARFIKK